MPPFVLRPLAAAAGAACLLVGCGFDEGGDLPPVVEAAAPAGADLVGSCGGSSGLIESPSYACTYVVPGRADAVAERVAAALAAQGFDVSCRRGSDSVEITGLRGDVSARGEVTGQGVISVSSGGEVVNVYGGQHTTAEGRPIPAGAVALRLSAARQLDASADFHRSWVHEGFPCTTEDLRRQTLAGCADAWNDAANVVNRRLAARRMRVPVAYVYLRDAGPGVSEGCSFGFLAPRGRYLILDASWDGDVLVFEEPELGYSTQRGLDAQARARPNAEIVLKPRTGNDRCETWWNAPTGLDVRTDALRRRLAGPVEAIYRSGEPARCTFLVRTRGRYYRAETIGSGGEWASQLFKRVPAPRFRPNGELLSSGWLSVAP